MFDEEWLRDYCKRTGKPLPEGFSGEKPKRSKYNAIKTTLDGQIYDSRKEARRAAELKLMAKGREIAGFAEQVTFNLPGGIKYIADFVILANDGTYRVEDVKGIKTDVYKLKKRLMADTYGIEIEEV